MNHRLNPPLVMVLVNKFYISLGLPVYSIYNKSQAELEQILSNSTAEVILVDLQDVGVRLYTFIWTLFELMKAAKALDLRLVVLDRPNPIGALDQVPL